MGEEQPKEEIKESPLRIFKELMIISGKLEVLYERMRLIEENRALVSQAVFDKVRLDYEKQLGLLRNMFEARFEPARANLAILKQEKEKAEKRLAEIESKSQELLLRHLAKEINEEDYERINTTLKSKKEKTEQELHKMKDLISRLEQVEEFKADETVFSLFAGLPDQGLFSGAPSDKSSKSDISKKKKLAEVREIFSKSDRIAEVKARRGKITLPVLLFTEGQYEGDVFPLKDDKITIGRVADNTLVFDADGSVSRHHAELKKEGKTYIIVDLNSSNGTTVNGKLIMTHRLKNGDRITIGSNSMIMIDDPSDQRIKPYLE